MKKLIISVFVIVGLAATLVGCGQAVLAAQDRTSPTIGPVKTSTQYMAKSDCNTTAVTVTAEVTDESGIRQATLWYRVGADQQFTPANLSLDNGKYSATVKALDVPGGEYGIWEFYITAEDTAGNKSQSLVDTSVQLLPCVG